MGGDLRSAMTARLVDQLYVEAMVLADEARAYFDRRDAGDRAGVSPEVRVSLACESLRVTTRLMHVIAWLLGRKAEAVGEAVTGDRQLGHAAASDPMEVALLPSGARDLVAVSSDLYGRVERLARELAETVPQSPARTLLGRLEGARF